MKNLLKIQKIIKNNEPKCYWRIERGNVYSDSIIIYLHDGEKPRHTIEFDRSYSRKQVKDISKIIAEYFKIKIDEASFELN